MINRIDMPCTSWLTVPEYDALCVDLGCARGCLVTCGEVGPLGATEPWCNPDPYCPGDAGMMTCSD